MLPFPLAAVDLVRDDSELALADQVINLLTPYWLSIQEREALKGKTLHRRKTAFQSLTYSVFDACAMYELVPLAKLDNILSCYRLGEQYELSYRLTLCSPKGTQSNFDALCRLFIKSASVQVAGA